MEENNKKIWWVVGIVVVLIAFWYIFAPNNKNNPKTGIDDRETIIIGVIAPMTAGGSIFGNAFVDAVKLAAEDATSTKYKYELVIEDDGTDAAKSASAAQKLINIDGVKALLVTTSGTGKASSPVAMAAKIPLVCVCTDKTVGDGKTSFTNLVLPEDEAAFWLNEAVKRGMKSIAMISQNHSGYNMISDDIKAHLKENGVNLVYEERFDPATKDFRTSIAKAKKTNPDMYFIPAFPPALEILGKQLLDSGIKNVSATAAFGSSADPAVFEGLWYTDGGMVDRDFQTRFEAAYPVIRFNVRTAPYGYDSFNMMVAGFEKGVDVGQYLSNMTEFEGKVGHITKEKGGANYKSTPSLYVIKNSKAELVTGN